MVAITNVLLFALSASASVIRRATIAQVQADLKTLNTDVGNLASKINAWDGTVAGSGPIQQAEQALENELTAVTNDANSAPVASSADSKTIIAYINSTLEPSIKNAITAIDNVKTKVQNAGLYSLVKNDLANLKSKAQTLGNALVSKASSDQKSAATTAFNKVVADIQVGVNTYA